MRINQFPVAPGGAIGLSSAAVFLRLEPGPMLLASKPRISGGKCLRQSDRGWPLSILS
jgi:hypothetical protein